MFTTRYQGDDLAALVNREVRQATDRLMNDISQRGQDTLYRTAVDATPKRTGAVAESWIRHETTQHGRRYEARISNSHPRAALLQYGTQPHEIQAEHGGALATPAGPRRDVHVSGIPAHHMVERAALTTESVINEQTTGIRERWARACEAAIESAKRKPR